MSPGQAQPMFIERHTGTVSSVCTTSIMLGLAQSSGDLCSRLSGGARRRVVSMTDRSSNTRPNGNSARMVERVTVMTGVMAVESTQSPRIVEACDRATGASSMVDTAVDTASVTSLEYDIELMRISS